MAPDTPQRSEEQLRNTPKSTPHRIPPPLRPLQQQKQAQEIVIFDSGAQEVNTMSARASSTTEKKKNGEKEMKKNKSELESV